jgi:uncharacterized protein (TIGR02466 family)
MNVMSLFPTAVSRTNIDRPLTSIEYAVFKNLSVRPNAGNVTSENNMILDLPELKDIKQFIINNVNEYFEKVISPNDNITPYITISWANVTSTQGYHHRHVHKNSIISGVFYPNADEGFDSIMFYKPTYKSVAFTTKNWNVWNSESWEVPTGTGDLLIFPSDLEHEVKPVKKANHERISLSFNVFVKGSLGAGITLDYVEIN